MRAGVLFAGIGGWEIACELNGVEVAWAAEWDDWKRERYLERWPAAALYRDVAGLSGHALVRDHGPLDILLGSPPCTDISAANSAGLGLDGDESRYYLEAIRLARETGARWVGFENSPRLRTRGADRVLVALDEAGYALWPCVVEAEDAWAPHERGRSFVVGCRRDWIEGSDAEPTPADPDTAGLRQPRHVQGAAAVFPQALARDRTAPLPHADGDRQPAGAVDDRQMGRRPRAGRLSERGETPCHSDRTRLAEWQGVSCDPFEKLTPAQRAALCPWDQGVEALVSYISVAHGLADRLRGHGLSERAVKGELARWRSALGDALVIPVVWAVVRSIVRTDNEWRRERE